jgi:type IV pilus assembly protein PilC
MPRYSYTAVSMTGENISGEYTMPDEAGVKAMLRQGGYYPLTIKLIAKDSDRATNKKIKLKSIAGFCSQISAMLRAGVPIVKTLEILQEQNDDKNLKIILSDVHNKVQKGTSLTEAFRPYAPSFPVTFINILEAGETSGTLDACMARAGQTYIRAAKLNAKVQSAMIYPVILLTLMIGIIILMLVFVIPSFADLYGENNAELPVFTQALLDLSDFIIGRWYLIVIVLIVVIGGFQFWLKTDKGRTKFDELKLRVPVINKLLSKIYASRYARTLSSLNASGVPLTQSLTVTARSVVNRYIEKALYKVVDSITLGENLGGPLERANVMPPMIIYMTKLGEESGTMDELLGQAADYYDDESDTAIQSLTAIMEPAMIIIMAVVIVPVIFAIIQPVFGMYDML